MIMGGLNCSLSVMKVKLKRSEKMFWVCELQPKCQHLGRFSANKLKSYIYSKIQIEDNCEVADKLSKTNNDNPLNCRSNNCESRMHDMYVEVNEKHELIVQMETLNNEIHAEDVDMKRGRNFPFYPGGFDPEAKLEDEFFQRRGA
ncbi:hypothetical protein L1987_26696 [Smallanthus sonchifolius]|uniref:Uncharacterized protein n=1 Tax=Smallanthus sonchifolius TaxID=185202 RepID=A0ACB9I9C5_9ASTR|nr:hypothetical protein L1987_26696 [Smallanthus sonchifolius]